jgi:hypothetical protein
MRGTEILATKITPWKEKAKERRIENEHLKRRIKELELSRDNWKSKYKEEKQRTNSPAKGKNGRGEKPKHHSYETRVILLFLHLRQQGLCSLRCCSKMMLTLNLVLNLGMKFPCANTIRNWETKHGLYRLSQAPPKGSEWMIIIDESIGIGKQKLLLILGIELGLYKFGEAPTLNDVRVLDMSISESWKWEKIQARIESLKSRGFNIKYAVSDGGASVVKSLEMSGIPRIADCTHVFGNFLKNRYKDSELFKGYSRACASLSKRALIGTDACMIPPSQRIKGKYLNLWPLANWGWQMLELLKKEKSGLTPGQREKLTWLKEYEPLVTEMRELCQTINELFSILKKEGLCLDTKIKCERVLDNSEIPNEIKVGILAYLEKYTQALQRFICSSDIIESTFGKYKRTLDSSTKKQINDTCLSIANYDENFSLEELKMAIEKIKIVDLTKWKEENNLTNLAEQKKDLLKNAG